jgi:hypothetical protein
MRADWLIHIVVHVSILKGRQVRLTYSKSQANGAGTCELLLLRNGTEVDLPVPMVGTYS